MSSEEHERAERRTTAARRPAVHVQGRVVREDLAPEADVQGRVVNEGPPPDDAAGRHRPPPAPSGR
jgi:hypothetical protein